MPNLGPGELIIICLVILVLFGAKKLPDAARSMGRSLRIFKAETKGLMTDDDQPHPPAQAGPTATPSNSTAGQQPPVAAPRPLPPGEGTTVNGVPLSEAQRDQRPS